MDREEITLEVLEKLLNPAVVWVFVPVLAILFWGIIGVIRALQGQPEDFEDWKKELSNLRTRVDKLEHERQTNLRGVSNP